MSVLLDGTGSGCWALLGFLVKLSLLLMSSGMATLLSLVTALICSTCQPLSPGQHTLVYM